METAIYIGVVFVLIWLTLWWVRSWETYEDSEIVRFNGKRQIPGPPCGVCGSKHSTYLIRTRGLNREYAPNIRTATGYYCIHCDYAGNLTDGGESKPDDKRN